MEHHNRAFQNKHECTCLVIKKNPLDQDVDCTDRELFSTATQCFLSIFTGVSAAKKNQIIKASAFAKVVAQFHCHSLSLCSDLTDHCLSMQLCTSYGWKMYFFHHLPDKIRCNFSSLGKRGQIQSTSRSEKFKK